ncbi:protein PF3D7_1417600-like isoform X2 [Condylostylus longicornis]|nr:protein PF3D7_1417600-like isoform X2 [Condylostylus longicornis]
MEIYMKNLVETYICETPQNTTKIETMNRRDESVMVTDADLKENLKYSNEEKSFDDDKSIQEFKANWKPVVRNLELKKKAKIKTSITPRSTRTARLRAELSRKSLLQPQKDSESKKITSKRNDLEITNNELFHRFINPNLGDKTFFEKNDISVVHNGSNTVFPTRIFKLTEAQELEKNTSTNKIDNVDNIDQDNIDNSIDHIENHDSKESVQENKDGRSDNMDTKKSSTWHDVLLEKTIKRHIYKTSFQKENKYVLQMKPNPTVGEDKLNKPDHSEELYSKQKINTPHRKKLINLGRHDLEVKEESEGKFNKLTITNLPTLYIKGECQIQNSFSVHIEPQRMNETGTNNNKSNAENTKFEELIYGLKDINETVNAEQKNGCTKEEYETNVEEKSNVREDLDPTRKNVNRYLLPFINSKTESSIIENTCEQIGNDSDSYETVSSTIATKSNYKGSKEEILESSSQTDDQKIKYKFKKRRKKIRSQGTQEANEIQKNQENPSEIINFVENIMKKFEEIPELNLSDTESEKSLAEINRSDNKTPQKSDLVYVNDKHKKIEQKMKDAQSTQSEILKTPVKNDQINENLNSLNKQATVEMKDTVNAMTVPESNSDIINTFFKKIYLDETEGLKTFKNNNKKNQNETTQNFDFNEIKSSGIKSNLSDQKKYQNLHDSNKAHTVSVGCNTEPILNQSKKIKEKYTSDRKEGSSESHYESSSTSTLLQECPKNLLKSQKSSSESSQTFDSCYFYNQRKSDNKFKCFRNCNILGLESKFCSRQKCFNPNKMKFSNIKVFGNLKNNISDSSYTLSNSKSYHKDDGKTNMFKNFSDNSNKSSSFDTISLYQGYFHNSKHQKPYESEVKRAVKNFLNCLETQPKLKVHQKENMDYNFDLKLSDILLTSSNFSTFSPTNSNGSQIDTKKEINHLTDLNLQKDSTFIIENKTDTDSSKISMKNLIDSSRNTCDVSLEKFTNFIDDLNNKDHLNDKLEINNDIAKRKKSVEFNEDALSNCSSSDNSLFVAYNKLKSRYNAEKQVKIEDEIDKENVSDGEVFSLGEI